MSSILDALNKLEEEKAARRAESGDETLPATPEDAAAELLGVSRRSRTRTSSRLATFPWLPVVSALFIGMAMTSAALVVVFRMAQDQPGAAARENTIEVQTYTVALRPEEPTDEALTHETSAASPVPEPVVSAPPLSPPPPASPPEPPVEITPAPASPPPQPRPELSRVAEAPPPAPMPTRAVDTSPAPIPAPMPTPAVDTPPTSTPTPAMDTPPAPPSELRMAQAPAYTAPTPSPPQPRQQRTVEVEVDALPRLSAHDRARLGLDNLRLNVLREADSDQPEGMAIINLKKVYVGETIPGTRARLIGVQATGIAIEMEDSRERFRIPR